MLLRQSVCLLLLVAGLAFWWVPTGALAQDESLPTAVVVFDSSFSMWGQLEGENKVVSVREGLSEQFSRLDGKINMGLIAYGHIANGGCSGVRTILPVKKLNAGPYSSAVRKVGPAKGSTPIAKAIEQAAELANYDTTPTSIILISDGLDNCQADPCAMAQKLRSRATQLRIHVIAFDKLRKEQLGRLACMAGETEGEFYSAENRTQLDDALGSALELAMAHGRQTEPDPATAAAPPSAPQQQEEARDSGEAAASAQTEAAGQAMETGQPDAEASGETMQAATPPEPAPSPAPVEQVQEQAAAETEGKVVSLSLSASLTEDSPALKSGLVWRVFSSKPDADGNFRVVARKEDAEAVFALQPGDYIVHAAYGRANITRELSLSESDHEENFVLNAGGLRLRAVVSGGTTLPVERVTYAIYSSEQDQFGQRKLLLPSVEAGKIIRLNAGMYHVVSQFGDANAVVRANVEVKAGQLSDAVVNHEAARITLKLVNEPGGEALANTSWSILTTDGEVVSESVGAFPSHILAAGKYNVLARHEGKSYNKEFAVQAGLNTEVELLAQ